jgi:hypothetical protein
MLLIYFAPIFAGIIGSRYLSRLGNFILMMLVFQLDMAILLGGSSPLALLSPYTVICIIPALVGIVGDRYLSKCKYDLQIGSRYFLIGKIANALLIFGMFWIGGVLLAYQSRGQFMPLSFLAGIFVSPGFIVPPLVFILIAIIAHPLRRFATP